MSRSGYSEDGDDDYFYLWRGAVNSAINGKRGQVFLRDLLTAMDAKPEKTLVMHALETDDGNFCALGIIGHARGVEMPITKDNEFDDLDIYSTEQMAQKLGIARALALEIAYLNDEAEWRPETNEQRFERVRHWVVSMIHTSANPGPRSDDNA